MQLHDNIVTTMRLSPKVKTPTVHCKVFEDNLGALEMARMPKMRPQTKHICIQYHHFREHVRKKMISIEKVASEDQLGDIATKPQPEAIFVAQRERLMQWDAEYKEKTELLLPTCHLRVCKILSNCEGPKAEEFT